MREEGTREDIRKRIDKIIKEIEDLEGPFNDLGKRPDYFKNQEEIINGLKYMWGILEKTYANIHGILYLPLSGEACIEDAEGNRHPVRKKYIEIDIEGNGQYLTVHMEPKKNSQQFDIWDHLMQYNHKKARF
ncbi:MULTISPECIES: hypothetical protein [Bacillus cereus group]|uniref:hypothetical protein n=1 Tax=Bacillus cereus group TaxID=86661 RepID=UPI000873332D|nr:MULTISPECIES: hypothetical protein [Bacillus cereus group]OFD57538.1 hypothetical protein BWGOE6_37080 [Bacillus mycoides]QWG48150.1 hypothetical protein EXW31_28700 [Bacillus mycoides]WJE23057.1 hypothetical protein QRE65_00055 [Bacillus cereus]